MSQIAAIACLSCTPATAIIIAEVVDTTPWIAGIAAVLVTGLMIPVVRWMMTRQDTASQMLADLAERRELREEKRQEAFQQKVGILDALVNEVRLMNQHHSEMGQARESAVKEILERIDAMPDKIAKLKP
jgi:hypothetical protein